MVFVIGDQWIAKSGFTRDMGFIRSSLDTIYYFHLRIPKLVQYREANVSGASGEDGVMSLSLDMLTRKQGNRLYSDVVVFVSNGAKFVGLVLLSAMMMEMLSQLVPTVKSMVLVQRWRSSWPCHGPCHVASQRMLEFIMC
ncbi:Uncharacterized protein TCM_045020 [Theobroma cacao]|uniref:Uncharacterized protein n=1 Tax=Theobroma cacao TaxID=3641 RepID=A0A061FY52_THECC|nr:Uncharacterized protein TCM_045020 [Theobroma cacao]